ncbi:hypothetical protein RHECNPAF_4090028 [Rhizobium etli CNPAF512]|nr:hypothetical protein RHECNPAF_4090028 [Rhizobium etli CNPAF512]
MHIGAAPVAAKTHMLSRTIGLVVHDKRGSVAILGVQDTCVFQGLQRQCRLAKRFVARRVNIQKQRAISMLAGQQ